MGERIRWTSEAAEYIRHRADRYPGAKGIEPAWVQEALEDPRLWRIEPDPKSRIGAGRFIGFSPGAGRLLVVIAYRDLGGALHLINAWPASGADVIVYEGGTVIVYEGGTRNG